MKITITINQKAAKALKIAAATNGLSLEKNAEIYLNGLAQDELPFVLEYFSQCAPDEITWAEIIAKFQRGALAAGYRQDDIDLSIRSVKTMWPGDQELQAAA